MKALSLIKNQKIPPFKGGFFMGDFWKEETKTLSRKALPGHGTGKMILGK